jgi:N-acetyl sugar amidotransferase
MFDNQNSSREGGEVEYCSKCVYPLSAANLDISNGICSACVTALEMEKLPKTFWERREKKFREILLQSKDKSKVNYDCLIPVSGGKDSYYQAHLVAKELGLKPLLVTYHGNNYLPEGDFNRDMMRHHFDADHIIVGPSIETLKKLNRISFRLMGDMNWQNHCGIMTIPIQIAVKYRIPLIIWGEIAWDISGMHDIDDEVEFNARMRHEHSLRGYEWENLISLPPENLTEQDLLWAKYPSDDEILDCGVKGIYVGNFYKWEPNKHTKLMKDLYGFKESSIPFQRTYRLASNLDDRYENGVHDLLKFVKFGYGRASDHASKDVRTGDMSRDQAVEMVRIHDHVISDDLYHWLDYVEMTESEFWNVADTFRDSRVWWIKDGLWWKDNVWGEASSYGEVHLSLEEQKRYGSDLR